MGTGELERLKKQLAQLRAQLAEREAEIARLQELADIDPLVPLLNRRAFLREAGRAWASAGRHGHGLALIFLDVDGLKTINDLHGHDVGDLSLIHVGDTLNVNTRAGDLVGRIGGDEFAVLLTHLTQAEADEKAKVLCELIHTGTVSAGDGQINVLVTCGVCARDDQPDIDSLLRAADGRMLRAKRKKR